MWKVLFYATPLTVGIALVVLAGAAVAVVLLHRSAPTAFPREARWLLGAACVVYLLILAAPILGWEQIGTGDRRVTWSPLTAYTELTAPNAAESAALIIEEKVVNVLLFVPIGILTFAALSPWWARLLVGPALSVTVETTQLALAAGHSSDTGDVLANSSGHLLGVAMAALAALLIGRPRTKGSHRRRAPGTQVAR